MSPTPQGSGGSRSADEPREPEAPRSPEPGEHTPPAPGPRTARLPPMQRVRGGHENAPRRALVLVCQGPSCSERGSPELFARLSEVPGAARLLLCKTSCLDHCATGPNVVVTDELRIQTGVRPSQADELARLLLGGGTGGGER